MTPSNSAASPAVVSNYSSWKTITKRSRENSNLALPSIPGFTSSPAFIHLVSGAIAGGCSRTLTAPLDRLKVVLQVTHSSQRVAIFGTFKRLIAEEGVRALFRGNGANCIKVVPECAIKFVAYDYFKRRLISARHKSEVPAKGPGHVDFNQELETEAAVPLSLSEKAIAGGIAGVVGQLSIYPLEVVKTRLATGIQGYYKGISDCLRKTLIYEGPQAFFKGIVPSLLGIMPYAGIDLACFETLKRKYHQQFLPSKSETPISILLLCGGVSSALGQTVAYPLALVRTRLQADGSCNRPLRYSGMSDVFKQTIKQEGYLALYRGLVPNLMKAVPAVSITWAIYESCKQYLHHFTQDTR